MCAHVFLSPHICLNTVALIVKCISLLLRNTLYTFNLKLAVYNFMLCLNNR